MNLPAKAEGAVTPAAEPLYGAPMRGALLAAMLVAAPTLRAETPRIVAAERVYGDLAAAIAGSGARVTSVLVDPALDPHEFEAPPSAARGIAGADIVIVNGLGYDPWADALVRAAGAPGVAMLNVAALDGRHPGDNPHCWFDTGALRALARALAAEIVRRDPAGAADTRRRLDGVLASLAALEGRLAALRARYAGAPVAATEQVADDLLRAAALRLVDPALARAQSNGTEPAGADIARLQTLLAGRGVRLLLVNTQVPTPLSARLEAVARTNGVPVVTVAETLPPDAHYDGWIGAIIDALGRALGRLSGAAPP